MAYNFPDAPVVDQVFDKYKWDGEKWIHALGGIAKSSAVAGDPYWANVKLLMGFNGADASTGAPGMTDESPVARGNATANGGSISTVQSVFGGSSLRLPGGNSRIQYADSADWHFSNQPFTVEFRMRSDGVTTFSFLVAQWGIGLSWVIYRDNATLKVNFSTTGSDNLNDLSSSTPIAANTWYAVCLDFNGTKYRLYLDGVMVASSTTVRNLANITMSLTIGTAEEGSYPFVGYIDELRITKGTARYASDSGYTVDATAFPRTAGGIVTTTLDFPNTPSFNQIYQGYTWDSEKWIQTIGGIKAPVAAWTPAQLTGLVGWWDASVYASMTITGGTDIQAIADQSGGGNNLVWDAFGRPQYNATGFNGKPAWVLGGTAVYNALKNTTFPMGTGNTLTLWWVGHIVSATCSTDAAGLISYKGAGQSTDYANASSYILCRYQNSSTQITMYRITNALVNFSNNANHRIIVTINSSGVQTFYIDGVSQAGATQVGNWTSPGVLAIGRSGTGAHIAGPTGEVGIATGYHDATTVAQLDDYLKAKWMPPSPYAIWDSATATAVTLSGDGLAATNTSTSSADQGARVAPANGKTSGKYYFEIQLTTSTGGGNRGAGVGTTASIYTNMGNLGTTGVMSFTSGNTWSMGSNILTWASAWTPGVWCSFAIDLDNRKYWWRGASGAGNWNNTPGANPATNVSGLPIPAGMMVPFVTFGGTSGGANNVWTANFGASAFIGTVPSGFTSGWPATTPAADFLARTTGLDATHVAAYTTLINSLVADGIWTKLDVLHIYATQDSTTARLNLVSTNYPATLNGSPTFTVDRGFTGISSSSTVYINTGFNPTTAPSPNFTRNSAHLSAWNINGGTTDVNSCVGSFASGDHNYLLTRYSDNYAYFRINNTNGVPSDGWVQTAGGGFYIGCRDTSAIIQGYKNGANAIMYFNGSTSAAPASLNVYALGTNNNGTAVGCGYQQAMVSIGGGMTLADTQNFYNRLRTYMTAVGVP